MIILVRYLSFAVLGAGFVLVATLPTLFMLAMGGKRIGPGRYRGACAVAPRLLRVIAWVVRVKALYGLALLLVVAVGGMRLSWWVVAPLAGLLIGWEAVLDGTAVRDRFLKERTETVKPAGPHGYDELETPATRAGANPRALWVLAAATGSLAVEMSLLFYLIVTSYYLSVL